MSSIYEDLHQFSSYVPPIDLTFHQYLLLADESILVHTGSVQQAEALVPQLKDVLAGRTLRYIFISHFESDECGGLSLILKHFPEVKPICSEVTARQLSGFGITNDIIIKRPGEKLISNSYELEFINYPSEMHLWEGLLLMENKRGIFFSSDLVFRFGNAHSTVIEGNWQTEIENITPQQVPHPQQRAQLQQTLAQLNPKFVATGHGQCLKF
ncbi:MBL fold metallo-hydrolase [Clostridium estertheticum]|uniref:MBL fold metallo-hydrolase n=1 Tax=Clostridium estertheticum TaxID=238834 RepID=UPI0013E90C07|nr:MBL fold metallo-hydrolase [Clostridium estertheticum]MBZ9688159.1 MBL fold metallo-hydrolase [Clostridium estertheticum]